MQELILPSYIGIISKTIILIPFLTHHTVQIPRDGVQQTGEDTNNITTFYQSILDI